MPTNPFTGLEAIDFAAVLQKLLPPADVFPGPGDAPNQSRTLLAFADQHAALHATSVTLLEIESDPAATLQLLVDWEAEYGLPDPCTPLNPTIEQRRIALLGKIASVGGQSDAYLIGVAAAMGYTITITHLASSRVGISACGDPLNGPECDYTMQINAPAITTIWSEVGQAQIGDPLNFIDNTQLECRLRAIAPASDYLLFVYS